MLGNAAGGVINVYIFFYHLSTLCGIDVVLFSISFFDMMN